MKLSQTDKKPKVKKPKLSPAVILKRVMALIICALMLMGVFAALLPFLGIKSYANEFDSDPEPHTLSYTQKVRVGLMYGTGVTVGFETKAEFGFNIGYLEKDEFIQIWQVTDDTVSVTCDSNLSKTGMIYSIANSNQRAIGGWHIEFTSEYQLENLELDIFPAFINGAIVYRTGQFGSEQEALTALESIEQHEQMYITGPSPTALSLVNPITNKILFEFDDPNVTFALTAVQSGDSEAYLITPAKNKYSGVFEFKRSGNGVALTNLLPLDDYVSGVLPWEIGVSWPIGVQKAFAVTVRTFTVSMLGRHNSAYGFDLCNDTHCQMYAGIGRSTALTYQAVSETAGMILTYNGIPARTFYSAVAGGVTVSSNEAWGGASSPYLKAIPTPWEDYSRHSNGSWTAEVSPTQLLNTLISKGYTQLKGSIADIKINKFAENSTYVYSITFTDTYGTKVTLERCDNIRSTLSAHLKSANFVVAKAGQPVTITQYSYVKDVSSNSNMYAMTSNGLVNINSESTINIMNNIGAEPIPIDTAVTVLTSDGIKTYNIDINEKPSVIETSDTLSLPVVKSESTVIAQGKSGNFVFIGKGWGHGVGMSQFGAMNLAELGYDYKTILNTYFPGTLLQDYLK